MMFGKLVTFEVSYYVLYTYMYWLSVLRPFMTVRLRRAEKIIYVPFL